jgi:putative ABC transport system permease protein
VTDFLADVRLALRSLMRRPGYFAVATITLTLGIGANTAVYSLVRGVLQRPLPYRDSEQLAILWKSDKAGGTTWLSMNEVRGYAADVRAFESVGAWTGSNVNITGGGEPERLAATAVTPSFFRTLGVAPARGTPFAQGDTAATVAPAEIIISHSLWQRRFGGVENIVGTEVQINGSARTIVGVMPADFMLPIEDGENRKTDVYVPIAMGATNLQGWGNRSFITVARVRQGASLERATGEMEGVERTWMDQGFIQNSGKLGRGALPLEGFVLGESKRMLTVLGGAVLMILLIACANVANLTLARSDERQREVAVRTALGASRTKVVRQLLTESLVLSTTGALVGGLLATMAVRALVAVNPAGIPRIGEVRIDGMVLAATLALAVVTGLLFGLWPAIVASRVNLSRTIVDGGRSVTAGAGRFRFRDALTVAQTASAIVLLIGSTLLVRSLGEMSKVNLGFRPDSVISARISLPQATYAGSPEVIAFYEQLVPKLASLPGAKSAGAARLLPLTGTIGDWSITIEGRVTAPNENPNGDWQVVTPGYFETMGASLAQGRFFEPTDRADAPLVAMVSEAMAAKYWPAGDAIGKRFHIGNANQPWISIVGIVKPMRHNAIVETQRTEMYVPHAQWAAAGANAPRAMSVVLRSDRDTRTLAQSLRATIREMDPNLPISELRTLREVTNHALATPRLATWLLGSFAVIAIVLAATGLYGVVALLVARRRQEIGVRMALGAQASSILRMVIGRGMRLAGVGALIGVGGALFLTRLLQGMLYGVTRLDPLTFIVVPAFFAGIVVLACLIPARRAAALDPLIALRED